MPKMIASGSNGRLFEFENTYFHNPKVYDFIDVWQIGELSLEAGYENANHVQPCHEISFIVSGEGTFYTDGKPCHVKAGDIHFVPCGHMHGYRVAADQNLRFSYLGFNFNDRIQRADYESLATVYTNPTTDLLHDNGNLRLSFYMLINELYGRPAYDQIMVESYIKQILVQVYRMFAAEQGSVFVPEAGKNVIGKSVYNIISFIDNHIYEIESVKYIANQLGYSQSYLSHLFKERMGVTLQQYLANKKIEASLPLLQQKRSTITLIALNLNYESVQSFGKAFKRVMNCTPSEYQKQFHREQDSDEEMEF
ncbi:MAG: AraC family transcriptional regulator [Oscillospiraceae bacterium]|nr:AraC family transcriptional regulator [Oscillospiraceae bacterium]